MQKYKKFRMYVTHMRNYVQIRTFIRAFNLHLLKTYRQD